MNCKEKQILILNSLSSWLAEKGVLLNFIFYLDRQFYFWLFQELLCKKMEEEGVMNEWRRRSNLFVKIVEKNFCVLCCGFFRMKTIKMHFALLFGFVFTAADSLQHFSLGLNKRILFDFFSLFWLKRRSQMCPRLFFSSSM